MSKITAENLIKSLLFCSFLLVTLPAHASEVSGLVILYIGLPSLFLANGIIFLLLYKPKPSTKIASILLLVIVLMINAIVITVEFTLADTHKMMLLIYLCYAILLMTFTIAFYRLIKK